MADFIRIQDKIIPIGDIEMIEPAKYKDFSVPVELFPRKGLTRDDLEILFVK